MTKTGGSSGGTIRFKEELAHGGNAGLGKTAVVWMKRIKKKYPGISYADLYTLGGGRFLLCVLWDMNYTCISFIYTLIFFFIYI